MQPTSRRQGHLLHANSARPQRPHRDHKHDYGKYFTVVFTIDESQVDTMLETEYGETHKPADCTILVYDTALHSIRTLVRLAKTTSKVFVGFSDPSFDQYNSIAKEHLHGRKKAYEHI